MPLMIEGADNRVKLQLGELLLSNIVLAEQLDQAQKQIADLMAAKQPDKPADAPARQGEPVDFRLPRAKKDNAQAG